jgi:hypothetical protein
VAGVEVIAAAAGEVVGGEDSLVVGIDEGDDAVAGSGGPEKPARGLPFTSMQGAS